MTWQVIFTPKAERDLKRLSKADGQQIEGELTAPRTRAIPTVPRHGIESPTGYSSLLLPGGVFQDLSCNRG